MLAPSFKSAADLGISDKMHDALVKVLALFERGEAAFAPYDPTFSSLGADYFASLIPKPDGFNMRLIAAKQSCGTACCLYGYARWIAGDMLHYDESNDRPLNALFMIGGHLDAMARYERFHDNIQPHEAAHALRNYLTTGWPDWDSVFEASSLGR